MGAWKVAAAVAVFVVAVTVTGAVIRLLDTVDDAAVVVSILLLAVVVISYFAGATRSRPLTTPYW